MLKLELVKMTYQALLMPKSDKMVSHDMLLPEADYKASQLMPKADGVISKALFPPHGLNQPASTSCLLFRSMDNACRGILRAVCTFCPEGQDYQEGELWYVGGGVSLGLCI